MVDLLFNEDISVDVKQKTNQLSDQKPGIQMYTLWTHEYEAMDTVIYQQKLPAGTNANKQN